MQVAGAPLLRCNFGSADANKGGLPKSGVT
jgi:hypothetical protein